MRRESRPQPPAKIKHQAGGEGVLSQCSKDLITGRFCQGWHKQIKGKPRFYFLQPRTAARTRPLAPARINASKKATPGRLSFTMLQAAMIRCTNYNGNRITKAIKATRETDGCFFQPTIASVMPTRELVVRGDQVVS